MAGEYGYEEGAEGSGNNVYSVLLILSFVMILIGIILCWNELGNFYKAPPWAASSTE